MFFTVQKQKIKALFHNFRKPKYIKNQLLHNINKAIKAAQKKLKKPAEKVLTKTPFNILCFYK